MPFGFDPSIILAGRPADPVGQARSLADLFQTQQAMRLQQAQEQRAASEFAYNQERRQSLADVYRQAGGDMTSLPQALMSRGFGAEGMEAQDKAAQAQQRAAQGRKAGQEAIFERAKTVGNIMRGVSDQQSLDAARTALLQNGFSQDEVAHIPARYEDAAPLLPRLTAFAMPADKQAEMENEAKKIAETNRHNAADEALKAREVAANSVNGELYKKYPEGGPAAPPSASAASGGLPPEAKGLKPQEINSEWDKLSDSVSTVKSRGNLNAKRQERLDSAERLEKLITLPGGQINNLVTPQQLREAGTSLANLISSGAISEHQIDALTPDTLSGKWADLKQKVLNKPQSAEAQEFLQNMLDTVARETAVTRSQIRAGQEQGLANRAWLRKVNPQRFDSILSANNLNPKAYNESGRPNVVKTDADWDALPSGAEYIAPNGKRKVKP